MEARNGALHRATSHPASNRPVNRLLNFSPERPRESVEFSPQRGSASQIQKPRISKGAKKGAKVFDLSMTDDYDNLETEATNGYGTSNGINEDEPALQNDDDQLMVDSTMDQEVPDDYTEIHPDETAAEESLAPPATSGALDSRSRRRGSNAPSAIDPDESQMSSLEAGKRRGRPPKKTRVFKDPMLEPDVEPVPSTSPARGRRKAPPAERDPNIQMKISKRKTSRKPSSRNASVGSTSRFVQRSATPANDSGALITRFGRQSIKPLATWRGEKAILGDRTVDALPSIERVIRVDEVVDQRRRPKRSINRSARRKAKSQLADVEEEEEEEEEEEKAPWEVDPGIMMAQVMDWNPDTNKYDEESTREEGQFLKALSYGYILTSIDIAYSFDAIEMRDISGADFKFAKTLTLDFFGSGMVHLPPGGAKRIKNSRKMQMVFFIFYGRVTVSLGTPATKFSIGKGGQWQVPRGKLRSPRFVATLPSGYIHLWKAPCTACIRFIGGYNFGEICPAYFTTLTYMFLISRLLTCWKSRTKTDLGAIQEISTQSQMNQRRMMLAYSLRRVARF